jgi:prevent-host-death family protein
MSTVTAFEAKTRFGELLGRVAKGEEIIITRHEKPVARLIPEGQPSQEEIQQAVIGLRDLRRQIATRVKRNTTLTRQDVKAFIEEGRK